MLEKQEDLLDTELQEVVEGAIEDVAVHLATDTVNFANISVLPHLPISVIAELIFIVTGYPEGVLVENGGIEMCAFEIVTGIDDGTDSIVFLDDL